MELHRPYRDFGKGYFDLGDDGALTLRNVPVPHYATDAEVYLGEDGRVVERTCCGQTGVVPLVPRHGRLPVVGLHAPAQHADDEPAVDPAP